MGALLLYTKGKLLCGKLYRSWFKTLAIAHICGEIFKPKTYGAGILVCVGYRGIDGSTVLSSKTYKGV